MVYKQQHLREFVCREGRLRRQETPRIAAKWGRKPKSIGPSEFCRICAGYVATREEYVPKFLQDVAQVNYHKGDPFLLAEDLHSITCFGILHPKSPPLSSENILYFALSISRSTFFFVDKTMEGIDPHPPTKSSLPVCAGVQFSRDSLLGHKYK